MPGCAVWTCRNDSQDMKCKGISFHRFPIDWSLRIDWIARCKRLDPFNLSSARICSQHFRKCDYSNAALKRRGRRGYKELKACAVPNLNLPSCWGSQKLYKKSIRIRNEKITLNHSIDRLLNLSPNKTQLDTSEFENYHKMCNNSLGNGKVVQEGNEIPVHENGMNECNVSHDDKKDKDDCDDIPRPPVY